MPACSRTARAFSAEMRRTSSSGGSSRSMCSSISGVTMRKFFTPMRSKSSRRRGDWEARMMAMKAPLCVKCGAQPSRCTLSGPPSRVPRTRRVCSHW